MPPTYIRRPMTISVWLVVSTICILASPLLLAVGVLVSAITGRRRTLIVARLILTYFLHELAVLGACGWLWVRAGAGRWISSPRSEQAHRRLVTWFVAPPRCESERPRCPTSRPTTEHR